MVRLHCRCLPIRASKPALSQARMSQLPSGNVECFLPDVPGGSISQCCSTVQPQCRYELCFLRLTRLSSLLPRSRPEGVLNRKVSEQRKIDVFSKDGKICSRVRFLVRARAFAALRTATWKGYVEMPGRETQESERDDRRRQLASRSSAGESSEDMELQSLACNMTRTSPA